MKFTRIVAIAVILGSAGIGTLQAQSFRDQPKEFPPASYKGKQYVDSSGCVFIRAGIDGNVTWVPRVSRKRDGVCGFKPTNVGTAAASPASPASQGQAPVQITLDNAPAQTTGGAVAAVQPRPVPKTRPAQPVARQAAPQVVRQTAPRPVAVAVAPTIVATAPAAAPRVGGNCPGRSALSQRYSNGSGLPVRCGPQAHRIVGTQRATAGGGTAQSPSAAGTVAVSPTTRIVPKHVAINRINTYNNVQVPKGYKPVWEDDRLNPKRAEQNLAGRTQMLLIWTNTVPRRLINQTTGQDLTAKIPLIYPYTSIDQQRRELGEVTLATRNGQLVKRIVRNPGGAPVLREPTYSSRSAAKPIAAAAEKRAQVQNGGSTYVQVGTFQKAANAQQTAQRIARMGMGARIGKSTRGGKTYLSVQAGPFTKSSAPHALGKLRGVGYRDAFIR